MQFWGGRGLTQVDPRNHQLDGAQDRTNPVAAAMDNKTAMRPFAKLFTTVVQNTGWRKNMVTGH